MNFVKVILFIDIGAVTIVLGLHQSFNITVWTYNSASAGSPFYRVKLHGSGGITDPKRVNGPFSPGSVITRQISYDKDIGTVDSVTFFKYDNDHRNGWTFSKGELVDLETLESWGFKAEPAIWIANGITCHFFTYPKDNPSQIEVKYEFSGNVNWNNLVEHSTSACITIPPNILYEKNYNRKHFNARIMALEQRWPDENRVYVYHNQSFTPDDIQLAVHTQKHLDKNNTVESMYGYFKRCTVKTKEKTKTQYICECDIGLVDQTKDVGCRYVYLTVRPGVTLCDIRIPGP